MRNPCFLFLLSALLSTSAAGAAAEDSPDIPPVGATNVEGAGGESCSGNCGKKDDQKAPTHQHTTTSTNGTAGVTTHQDALLEWIRSRGGYFNDKVRFQPLFEGGPNGMFAQEDLAKNETLIVVPQECLLTSDYHDGEEPSYNLCDTARRLVEEHELGAQSLWAPYVHYIFQQEQHNKLPAAWSERAKELLEEIVGDELEPRGMTDIDFWKRCHGEEEKHNILSAQSDPEAFERLYRDAYRSVVSRSWNDVMIPVYDMVNHRNGHYHNLDQLNTCHDEENDVVIVALRDVRKGEQLYISYNECHDSDCVGIEHTYVLPNIMKDYGFVEQYPRRWWLTEDGNDPDSGIVFQLNQDEETLTVSLEWISDEPDPNMLSFLRGHLQRQQEMHPELVEETEKLESEYEKDTILEYHEALVFALEMAIQETFRKASKLEPAHQYCVVEADGQQKCTYGTAERYDNLEPGRPMEYEGYDICSQESSRYLGDADYESLDETTSFYQTITFEHNYEIDDTCLYLSGWLQTCTTWRPHYHESVVHVPATFLDNVTRVAFLGGGDNMMIHEVLKYSGTLEFVLGMELDQAVVRQAFKTLGNQPHFDHPKVRWMFGDATKSLALLPEEYFGTFDLVIVDLQTNVIETLQVTPTKTIMDVALDLLKPEGILARNEDFYPRRSLGFAKYEVDLEFLDVPMLCQQSITIGSKGLNFLAKKPIDHGVASKNVYQQAPTPEQFSDWFNYRNNPGIVEKKEDDTVPTAKHGLHMILEVEKAKMDNTSRNKISQALSEVGFAEMSVSVHRAETVSSVVFLFQQGYLLAQFHPKVGYVGYDLKLWDMFDKLEEFKDKLIAVVNGKASSRFGIVTGGMYGLGDFKKNKEAATQAVVEEPAEAVGTTVEGITPGALETITQQMHSLIPVVDSIVAVLCPEKANGCETLNGLYKQNLPKIVPIYACRGMGQQDMYICETETLAGLKQDVETAGGKIGGILVDPAAPKSMGQILHTLFTDKSNRIDLLEKQYVFAYTSPKDSTPLWQRALLERFQSQFDPFSPALRAQAFLNSKSESVELGVFSAGNPNFYAYLERMLEKVEQETGLGWEVRKVEDGIIGYVADFHPSVIPANADYDKADPLKQWHSQKPLGQQTIFQFGIQTPMEQLDENEVVLVEYNQDVWKGEWLLARVIKESDQEGSYVVDVEGEESLEVERGSIRKLDFLSDIQIMDQVLINRSEYWSQGAVIEKSPDGNTFRVRRFDSNGDVMTVRRRDLVPRVEAGGDSNAPPSLASVNLSSEITNTLQLALGVGIDEDNDVHVFRGLGSGCVINAFWYGGCAVVTWDGNTHLDVSLVTDKEDGDRRQNFVDGLIEKIPNLVLSSRDDYPRGYGRVVNFESEVRETPRWVEAAMNPEADSDESDE